jgi:curli biogenesis system outer membrane secretion channel CsgG
MTILKRVIVPLAVLFLFITAGCRTPGSGAGHTSPYRSNRVVKPVMAVADFQNLANVQGQWNLGKGMADVLVTQLLDTDRVIVLERKDLKDVLNEIVLQGGDLFRKEGKVDRGRLKNAKYLVRGSVTDFTETNESSGWFGISWLRVFGRGSQARVAINIKVSDVETGEIVSSVKAAKTVSAGGVSAEGIYKDVAFGGDAFFRTPLGKATESAIRSALHQILRELPTNYWQPRVAEFTGDTVVINGGKNVRVRIGDKFIVRESPRDITDPATGNVIETVPGRVVGRIEITKINDASAYAVVTEGVARRGDFLETIKR